VSGAPSGAGELLPAGLAQGLVRVDDPLAAARYREALAALGAPAPELGRFHVDAGGYSPELADALGDPFYLGGGPLEARAIVLSPAQLAAPLVHPGMGFAAAGFRRALAAASKEIGTLTLREAVLVELEPEGGLLRAPRELADPARFVLRIRTPGGLLEGADRLEAMKREFLASERRWLDDDYIAELGALAARVRDLPPLPEALRGGSQPLGPAFFTPAFGGCYVIEEPGASLASAATSILAALPGARRDDGADGGARPARAPSGGEPEPGGPPSSRGRRVELLVLEAESALEILERHGLARYDPAAWRARPAALARMRHWLALDAALAEEPDRAPPLLGERDVAARLRDDARLPPEHRDLAELLHRLATDRTPADPEKLAPRDRLRLALPATRRADVRRWVRHLQAFLDPLDLGLAWCHAPDLLFARLPSLSSARRAYLARWLEANAAALRAEPA
jgi:hypothetical protein